MNAYRLTLITTICTLYFLTLVSAGAASNARDTSMSDSVETVEAGGGYKSIAHVRGVRFVIIYDKRKEIVTAETAGKRVILHRIPHELNPELVDSARLIKFLPLHLQPYRNRDYLLYTVAVRSSKGNGKGYCGSGIELNLHILNIRGLRKRSESAGVIGSCLLGIELSGTHGLAEWEGLSVVNGRLQLNFISYENHASGAIGILSEDPSHIAIIPRPSR